MLRRPRGRHRGALREQDGPAHRDERPAPLPQPPPDERRQQRDAEHDANAAPCADLLAAPFSRQHLFEQLAIEWSPCALHFLLEKVFPVGAIFCAARQIVGPRYAAGTHDHRFVGRRFELDPPKARQENLDPGV